MTLPGSTPEKRADDILNGPVDQPQPLVSIVTPCFNGESHVGRLIRSVLDQTYPNIEFILVNDGSTDGTEGVVAVLRAELEERLTRFVYMRQENTGLGGAISAGLRHVTGDYLCWPDADDYLEPTSVTERVAVLEAHPEYAVVTSDAFIRHQTSLDKVDSLAADGFQHTRDEWQFEHLLRAESIFTSGSHMARMSSFDETHPGRAIYPARRGQNWQILLPLYHRYKRLFLDRPLYNYIVYQTSMSRDSSVAERLTRAAEHRRIKLETLETIPMSAAERRHWEAVVDDMHAHTVFGVALDADDVALAQQALLLTGPSGPILGTDRHRYPVELALNRLRGRIAGGEPQAAPASPGEGRPSASVLVTTYNGAAFIEEQLASILAQSEPPRHVVICDDGSTDDTVELVEAFIERNQVAGWTLVRNERNLGPAANVLSHLSMLTGDLVFLADQDDVWEPDRIAVAARCMTAFPQLTLCVTRTSLIGSDGDVLRDRALVWGMRRDAGHRYDRSRDGMRLDPSHFLGYSTLPLHAMCVRGDVAREVGRADVFPQLSRSLGADWFIGAWSTILGKGLLTPERLIRRRVHGANISLGRLRKGTVLAATPDKRLRVLSEARDAHVALLHQSALADRIDERLAEDLRRVIDFLGARIAYAERPSVASALRLLRDVRLYTANGGSMLWAVRTWLADVMYANDVNWRLPGRGRRRA